MSAPDGPARREVAHRLFAAEFNEATLEYSDSDEDRAPKYVITPTGGRINRLFVVGVLTEVEWVNDDVIRARIADPTGAFVVYAGQYQPEALSFLERAEPPGFVAITGKANTFRPDGSDRVFTSIRPESINDADVETRDRWTVQAAEHTLQRVDRIAAALSIDGSDDRERLVAAGVDPEIADGISLALDHYGTTTGYLDAIRRMAIDALRLVAERVDTVETPTLAPGESGDAVDPSSLRLPKDAPLATLTIEPGNVAADDRPTEAAVRDAGDNASGRESTPPAASDPNTDETEPAVEMYELDDEERAEVEAEFGTEFETGAEVDGRSTDVDEDDATDAEPATVGVEEPGTSATAASESAAETGPQPDAASGEVDRNDDQRPTTPEPTDSNDESADDDAGAVEEPNGETDDDTVDLEDAVIDAMEALAGEDGAGHDAIVEAVVEEHDVDPAAVEGAIEDALMSGRCYEPQDGVFKPI